MAVNLKHRNPDINKNVVVKEPVRVNLDATGKPCGLAEFKEDEVVQIEDGGTGADTAEGARKNLEVFSEMEITDKIVHNIVSTETDFEAEDYQQVIVKTEGATLQTGQFQCTVTLPEPLDDREVVVVADGSGNAQNRPIRVVAKAGKSIEGDTECIININNARVVFTYTDNEWRVSL
jgi:hypothetical protein